MNIYDAWFFGLLPAIVITVILLIKKRRRTGVGVTEGSHPGFGVTASVLAVLCVSAAALFISGIFYIAPEPEIPPDELLRICRLYLESGKDKSSLPPGFVYAGSEVYQRLIGARPELAAELGPEESDPVSAELCRRLRSSAALCGDKQAAYMTLAELEFYLGHTEAAEAALEKAFSFVPGYSDAGPYPSGPDFAAFAGDFITRRQALFDGFASCPPDGRVFSLRSSLVYMTGDPAALAITDGLPEKDSFVLLKGRRSYMIAVSDGSITLPADMESGEYALTISDGTAANTSPLPLYITRGMTETVFGDYVFTSCAVYPSPGTDGSVEAVGLAALGGWLRFNGGITIKEKDEVTSLSFQSAFITFGETSPFYGGALTVTPEKSADSKNGSPFVFQAAVTAGSVRLAGVTVTLYSDRMELMRNGKSDILPDAVSQMLSGEHISAEIKGTVGEGKLFLPYADTLPPVLEINPVTEEGSFYIITGVTESGCALAVNGKSIAAGQGSFVYKTAAVDDVRLVITAEDKTGNQTLREIRLKKDRPVQTAFSFYSFASFYIICAAAAVNSAAAAFFVSDERIIRLLVKYRRRIFVTASVFCLAAAGSLIVNALSEKAKIASSALIGMAKASPVTAYEIIKGPENSFIAAAVFILSAAICLTAGLIKKKTQKNK